ncbi:uncharacterized protein LOC142317839 [Lycorma delicatula]|uniref:uncharacterized protein LOC142317839 n=1 Tax=Lycorma delicatula TaxID=130591 RepID=UPI003F5186EB
METTSSTTSVAEVTGKNPRSGDPLYSVAKRKKCVEFSDKETFIILEKKDRTLFQPKSGGPTPKYLVTKKKDDSSKISLFVIARGITEATGGPVKDTRKTAMGLFVETVNDVQSSRLLKATKIGLIDVEVVPHGTLNTSKGVVRRDLLNCTEDEIVEELCGQGVIACRRLNTRRNGDVLPSASHVLTFNIPKCPEKIKAGFHSLDVRPFIPTPLRCFGCQKFGRTAARYTRKQGVHVWPPPAP